MEYIETNVNEELKQQYVNCCIEKYKEFEDKLRPYVITEDIEKIPYEEWRNIMLRAKNDGVILKHRKSIKKEEPAAPIKPLNEYDNEVLKKLYKSYSLYIVTEWFKYRKRYKSDTNIECLSIHDGNYYEQASTRVINNSRIRTIETYLMNEKYKDEDEKQRLIIEKTALEVCNEVIFWCGGGFMELKKMFDEGKNVQNPIDIYNELHESDDIDIEYGRGTKFDIYLFIWETLRFCDLKTLCKLSTYADKKFEIVENHRPRLNKKIYKYDRLGNLIATFENRQDCIEKDGIGKECLSRVINSKRKAYHGFRYEEEKD